MTASIRSLPRHDDAGPGVIESLDEAMIVVARAGETLRCLNGLASLYAPHIGDTVLVTRGAAGEGYVTGVLSRGSETPVATLSDGATVRVDDASMTLRDARGAVVFEYRAGEGRTVLRAARGDLELHADEGDITLHAAGQVKLRADTAFEVSAAERVRLDVDAHAASPQGRVELTPGRTSVTAGAIEAKASRVAVHTEDAKVVARTLSTAVETSRVVAAVIETTAERVVTRAKNVFEEVEELSQTQAGRMRTLVRGALHVFSKRAVLKADDDVKIKGERIHLG